MKYRALLRHLERKLPEPPPHEIIIRWVDRNAPDPNNPDEEAKPMPAESASTETESDGQKQASESKLRLR